MDFQLIAKTKMDEFENDGYYINGIIHGFNELIKKYNYNEDLKYYINNELVKHGYPVCYELTCSEKKIFDNKEYISYIKQATKSFEKTKELISYLKRQNSFILTLCSIKYLKVEFLIKLNLFETTSSNISKNENNNFRDLIFNCRMYDYDSYLICKRVLKYIGIEFLDGYIDFILDMEFLLWTIERDDPKYGFYKSNTLKVALNIARKEYFEFNDKEYYNFKFSKVTMKYLNLIDKEYARNIIKEWYPLPKTYYDTGYKVLFNILCIK